MASTTASKSKTALGAVVAIALGIAVVAGVGVELHAHSYLNAPTETATINGTITAPDGKSYPHAFITDGLYADPIDSKAHGACATCDGGHPTWPSYGPFTHFVLPAHAYVTVTMHVYDGGEKLNTPYFANVVGTVGGTMNVDGTDVTSLAPDGVQHTFTIHGLPTETQDPLFVNIPMPKTGDGGQDQAGSPLPKGHVVTFSFITGGKGNYVWNCEYPCGDTTYQGFGAVMGAQGYMSGKVTVL